MIHQYKLNGYNIVIDVYSGSVHAVDEVAYDIIGLYENTAPEEIVRLITEKYPSVTEDDVLECLSDIEDLKKAGKLFKKDDFEGIAFDFKKRSNVIKALCLHVAHTCNLNCEYCFASQGKYNGDRALMSFEVGKRALDFLVENSGSRKNLEVDFFGGEPLMNWDVVKRLVEYARSIEKEKGKNFRFTLTTNGILVDATASYPSFRNLPRPAATKATTSAGPIPITTWTLPRTFFISLTSALRSSRWSPSSARPTIPTP